MAPSPMSLHFTLLLSLAVMLVSTTYSDLRWHRIRNAWTLGGASFALLLHLAMGGPEGLWTALLGFGTGLVLFMPIYLVRGMAAGDVKLMAAVGTLVGPKLALIAAVATLMAGGVLALAYLVVRRDIVRWVRRWNLVLTNLVVARGLGAAYVPPSDGEVAGQRFPYALAIAAGTLTAVWLFADQAPAYLQVTG